ncbi:MAG: hypothetical protein LBS71_02785 [Puniceicoccales bacterium]|jgi:hypothetical protein|nr:hypothetical protein [Puniceicoccales bacterium]
MGIRIGSFNNFTLMGPGDGNQNSEEEMERKKIFRIFQKKWGDYSTLGEVKKDKELLEVAQAKNKREGRFFSIFSHRVDSKLKKISVLLNNEYFKSIMTFVKNFFYNTIYEIDVEKKEKNLKERLEAIYEDHTDYNIEEEEFYGNILFLKQVRHLISEKLELEELKKLWESVNSILEGTSFWKSEV